MLTLRQELFKCSKNLECDGGAKGTPLAVATAMKVVVARFVAKKRVLLFKGMREEEDAPLEWDAPVWEAMWQMGARAAVARRWNMLAWLVCQVRSRLGPCKSSSPAVLAHGPGGGGGGGGGGSAREHARTPDSAARVRVPVPHPVC